MPSRTSTRGVKTPAGVHTVRIPRQRGRRSQPFVVVVPERPTLTREAFGFLGRTLWRYRGALAPTGLALLAWPVTALLHAIAWWCSLLLAPIAAAPLVWLAVLQRNQPARTSAMAWRFALTALAAVAFTWVALAAGFGPLTGPLPLIWVLTWLISQTAWLVVRSR